MKTCLKIMRMLTNGQPHYKSCGFLAEEQQPLIHQSEMASITITTTLLLTCTLAAYYLQITAGAPHAHKRDITGAPATAVTGAISVDDTATCSPLIHDYCKSFDDFGGRTVGFPNPRQVLGGRDLVPAPDTEKGETWNSVYYANALKEFNEFVPLLSTQCSDKLGTLLCFFYFPFCAKNEHSYSLIRPCLSICEEVTQAASDCTAMMTQYGYKWPEHFKDCENYNTTSNNGSLERVYQNPGVNRTCAGGAQMPWPYVPPTTPTTLKPASELETTSTTAKMEGDSTTSTTAKIEVQTTTTETIEITTTKAPMAPTPTCSPCNAGKEVHDNGFQNNNY